MTSVLIVGGGPAGAAAAISLANAQIPVMIVERASFPRYRPGETLHPGIEPLLIALGVAANLHAAPYLRHKGIWSCWGEPLHYVPYGENEHGPWRGFQAPGGDFDARMLASACDRGARLIRTEVLDVMRNSADRVIGLATRAGPLGADFIIDCSGNSRILPRRMGIAEVQHSPKLIARFGYVTGTFDGLTPSIRADSTGWTWIAEVELGRIQWTRVTEACNRPSATWRPECLNTLKAEASYGADVTWRMAQAVAGPGWFLAGDCAAILDPSSSHGVLRALMTGMMAAHLIVQCIGQGQHPAHCAMSYQSWLSAWFHHDTEKMSRAYELVNLFGFGAGIKGKTPISSQAEMAI